MVSGTASMGSPSPARRCSYPLHHPADAGVDLVMGWWSLDTESIVSTGHRTRDEDLLLLPGESAIIGSLVRVMIPAGWHGDIKPRSGLGIRQGLTCHMGTIDATFSGELVNRLTNHGAQLIRLHPFRRALHSARHESAFSLRRPALAERGRIAREWTWGRRIRLDRENGVGGPSHSTPRPAHPARLMVMDPPPPYGDGCLVSR